MRRAGSIDRLTVLEVCSAEVACGDKAKRLVRRLRGPRMQFG